MHREPTIFDLICERESALETAYAILLSFLSFLWSSIRNTAGLQPGSSRVSPDPVFPPLFRENPASRPFFIGFLNPASLSQKNILSLISTKANKCKM